MSRILENINVGITIGNVSKSEDYILEEYIPSLGEIRGSAYSYYKIYNRRFDGIIFKVRTNFDRDGIVDFKAVNLKNKQNLSRSNVTFFIQGEYHVYENKFKSVKTGNDLLTSMMDVNFDSMLIKVILDFIWLTVRR